MDLPELHLWERAAIRPAPGDARPQRTRRERGSKPLPTASDLRLARRHRARIHAATRRGLLTSVVLCVPLGWSFAQSSLFADDPGTNTECVELALLLGPDAQRSVGKMQASGDLSRAQRSALGQKVCGSALQSILEPLLGDLADVQGLREMAHGGDAFRGDAATLPMLKTLLAQSGPKTD